MPEDNIKQRAKALLMQDRMAKVSSIKPESDLHKILQQLLERMNAVWVEIRQGNDEFGKDLLARVPSALGSEDIVAVVAKLGKISGKVDSNSSVSVVLRQLDQLFQISVSTEKEASPLRVTMAIVACTGEFSSNAKQQIVNESSRNSRRVLYWDIRTLTEQLTEYMPEFFFDINKDERDYLIALQSRLSDLSEDMKRYGKSLNFALDDIFVDPRVAILEPLQLSKGFRKKRSKTGLIEIQNPDIDVGGLNSVLERKDSLLVVGAAGSGKSTLLKKAAHELCMRRMGDHKGIEPFPVWISAKKLSLLDERRDVIEALEICNSSDLSKEGLIKTALVNGGLVVFVDDIDMVPFESRTRIRKWLESIAKADKRIKVLAASRMSLFNSPTLLKNYKPTFIFPFRIGDIRALLERILGKERAYRVLEAFVQQNRTNGLPHTPLVVTLLAILHKSEVSGEVPANIAELYRMVSEVYLGKWSDAAGDHGLEKHALLNAVAKSLAYDMQTKRVWVVNKAHVEQHCSDYLANRHRAEKPSDVIDGIIESGLFVFSSSESNDQQLGFSDRSFQEFFCALFLLDHPEIAKNVTKFFADPWWSNVVTFLAGLRRDSPEIIYQAILATTSIPPENSLTTAMQFGSLLQAASLTPTSDKVTGVLHATDLVQYFYSSYAERLSASQVSIKLSRSSLILTSAILFAFAFESRHLAAANRDAALELLARYESAEGDDRFIRGIRALCAATSLAAQQDFSGLSEFVRIAAKRDYHFFGAVSLLLETTEPKKESSKTNQVAWDNLVRAARKLAPPTVSKQYGPSAARQLTDEVLKLRHEPRLLDPPSTYEE